MQCHMPQKVILCCSLILTVFQFFSQLCMSIILTFYVLLLVAISNESLAQIQLISMTMTMEKHYYT